MSQNLPSPYHALPDADWAEVIDDWRKDERRGSPGNGKAPAGRAAAPTVEFDALLGAHGEGLLERKLLPIDAVPTPFPAWSGACRDEGGGVGLARGWHVLGAARTGMGKSVWALNVARHAVLHGETVTFVSLEMSQPQLETRMLAIVAGLPVRSLEQGRALKPETHRAALRELEEIHERTGGTFISNRRTLYNLPAVEAAICQAHDDLGSRFFVVDYLQLAAVDPNDPSAITEVSHRVRQLAKDLSVITVGLSQFNRLTSASKERPTVHGLMGGSALENDSDQVVLLDHSRVERAPAGVDGWHGYAMLDKNRHGPLTEIPILFNRGSLRMTERAPEAEAPEAWAA
jgi:replicative DNA helicase